MPHFKYCRSYQMFERQVKYNSRYIFDKKTKEFLRTVLETSEEFRENIPRGKIFWRAQIGYDEKRSKRKQRLCPYPSRRMKPQKGKAREGRANPKGIPLLYLTTHEETAIAEVRPWTGSIVSVAQFETRKDLVIVNFTEAEFEPKNYKNIQIPPWDYRFDKEPEPSVRNDIVWVHINESFSKPVTITDDEPDYIPTQIISELFKSNGYDGIAYKSALGPGHNVALFNPDVADIVGKPFLCEVKKISVDFLER